MRIKLFDLYQPQINLIYFNSTLYLVTLFNLKHQVYLMFILFIYLSNVSQSKNLEGVDSTNHTLYSI